MELYTLKYDTEEMVMPYARKKDLRNEKHWEQSKLSSAEISICKQLINEKDSFVGKRVAVLNCGTSAVIGRFLSNNGANVSYVGFTEPECAETSRNHRSYGGKGHKFYLFNDTNHWEQFDVFIMRDVFSRESLEDVASYIKMHLMVDGRLIYVDSDKKSSTALRDVLNFQSMGIRSFSDHMDDKTTVVTLNNYKGSK
jgi:hypothetical protein